MEDKLLQLIKSSDRILITSHISPDPDAVSSVLLLGNTLKLNFSDKQITIALDEETSQDLSFLAGYSDIKFGSLLKSFEEFKPDLLVSVDAAGVQRLSRNDSEALSGLLKKNNVKTAIIDHHPEDPAVEADLYIKSDAPATAQTLYELLFEQLNFKRPEGYAEATLLGILRDSGRFKYANPDHKNTFRVVSELLDAGASIEKLEYRLDRYEPEELEVLAELLSNTDSTSQYTCSFISDSFANEWKAKSKPISALKGACDVFSAQFLRNVGQNYWGFVVYPELQAEDKSYSVSFRAVSGGVDVAAIAQKLGGGGHKQAAGAKNIKANDIQAAIEVVRKAIG